MSTFDRWGPVARSLTPFSPVVDGEVLPTDPWTGLGAGAARDVPLLVGHNRGEWRLMLAAAGQLGAITDAMATTAMQHFGPGPDPVARMRAAYPDASAEELLVLAHSDHAFRMPSLHLGRRAHRRWRPQLPLRAHLARPRLRRCAGGLPLPGGPARVRVLDRGLAAQLIGTPPPPEARELSVQMQTAWTAFARDGRPGWPAHDDQHQSTRVFDNGARGGVRPYPETTSRRLWADAAHLVLDLQL